MKSCLLRRLTVQVCANLLCSYWGRASYLVAQCVRFRGNQLVWSVFVFVTYTWASIVTFSPRSLPSKCVTFLQTKGCLLTDPTQNLIWPLLLIPCKSLPSPRTYRCALSLAHTHTHTHTHRYTQTYSYTHLRAHEHARTRTHMHTHARTHTCSRSREIRNTKSLCLVKQVGLHRVGLSATLAFG